MSDNNFNNDDNSRRLNKNEIAQVFHGIQEDFNMLTVENIDVATMFVDKQTIASLVKMAEAINAELSSAEEFYSALGVRDTVSTTSFVKFLRSMEEDISKIVETFEDITVFASESGEKITARKFFNTFIRIILILKISILMGENFEEKMDKELLTEEHERMKREGLI